MKSDSKLKYQNITFIKGLKKVYCALVLKDGRIAAIVNNYLKIYNGKSFNFDFEIQLKQFLDESDGDFTFCKLLYLKNGYILVNNNHRIFFIIKIIDNEKNIIFWKNLNLIENFVGLLEFVNYQIIQL